MQTHCYLFNDQCDVESWLQQLAKDDLWQAVSLQENLTAYYDTFDWRLYRKGATLELESSEGRRELIYRSHKGDLLASSDHSEEPGFAWDLPIGQLRQQLEPLIKMRRLLPQVAVCSRKQSLAMLNRDRKTVLRMVVFFLRQAIDSQGNRHSLRSYLQVLPVQGYRSALNQVNNLLGDDLFLQTTQFDPLADALATLGRSPADYSSKLNLSLQPTLTAQQALRTILNHLLSTLRTNIEGTCNDLDSEFLHDLRVSVRRTRSALNQLKGLLPTVELAPFREGFAWLGNITGLTRDLDVYLLKYSDYVQLLPESHRQDLVPFHNFLKQRQAEEQEKLAALLEGAKSSNILALWQEFLDQEREADPTLPDAELPVKEVADRRIWKLYKRCLKEGHSIATESPAEALHELRKTCKKLRYLLEFFQSLYPPIAIKTLIKSLKVLQDNLGDFQDYQVQGEAIYSFGIEMAAQNRVPPATLLAMGILASSLFNQQQQTRDDFDHQFQTFSQPDNHRLFQKLFSSTK
ncbi:hypothetical protein A7E78_02155 [Syntrophotalea acetylenivorans]|uniref:CHAD domain-containing protein n=1 Tax=Syntrophotalea acetylenivorans TaxID=1842532 RepID=A0A1L3GLF0_9BACT|nr:CHAD domain-containing protein [Syntrophotalea acetylenivorans]APG26763.1 hypothetical protein A7E78_02155 [Syntrophotalea acetylenivorans]